MIDSPKEARETLGLNQTKMSRAMGIHRNHWLKFERGERPITAGPKRTLEILLLLKSEHPTIFQQLLEYF